MSNFDLGAAVVIGTGVAASALMGTIGCVTELLVKEINPDRHPQIRLISESATKCLQALASALAITAISILFPPPVSVIVFGASFFIILTPLINAVAKQTNHQLFKTFMEKSDLAVSATSKLINTAAATSLAYFSMGTIPAVAFGITLGSLSLATFLKK